MAGIDVGGARKGFHAVALYGLGAVACFHAREAAAVVDWCRAQRARVVAVDAPCRWSATGKARAAERALAALGVRCFATPVEAVARSHPFYAWMCNGERLYAALTRHWRLFDGAVGAGGPLCCETYPHAVAWALAGTPVRARDKRELRRRLLDLAGVDTAGLVVQDYIDAALCALAARGLVHGQFRAFGDAAEGYIVVPLAGVCARP
ncbi:MAG: DUF429 domain-containing protein [Burkholderiales bacterium]|nr:DUF429 domain-containing protein [Burkholderiales bacterium]